METNNNLQEQLDQVIANPEIERLLDQLWALKFEKLRIETSIETAYNLVLPSIFKKQEWEKTYVPLEKPYLQKIWGYKSTDKLDPEQLINQDISVEKVSELVFEKIKYTIGGKLGTWNIKKFEHIYLKDMSDEVIKELTQIRNIKYFANKFLFNKMWLADFFDLDSEYTNLDNFKYYKITAEYSNFIKHYHFLQDDELENIIDNTNKESFEQIKKNLQEFTINANIDITTIVGEISFDLKEDEILLIIPKYTLVGVQLIKNIEKEFSKAANNDLKNKAKDLNLLHQKNSPVFNSVDKNVLGMPKEKRKTLLTNLSKEINRILFPEKNYMDLKFLGSRTREEIQDMRRIVEIRNKIVKIKFEKEKKVWERIKKLASAELLKKIRQENKQ